ncbi:MAG: ESPR domain-containing protein, partial [Pelistega sp.]|nr:ESPR domain-containing protein [Pelistega sp.]
MNKVFRSIYNESLGTWVATSELSSACGKKTGSSRLLSKPQSENTVNAQRRLQALSVSLLVLLGLSLSPTISYAQQSKQKDSYETGVSSRKNTNSNKSNANSQNANSKNQKNEKNNNGNNGGTNNGNNGNN